MYRIYEYNYDGFNINYIADKDGNVLYMRVDGGEWCKLSAATLDKGNPPKQIGKMTNKQFNEEIFVNNI